MRKNAAIGIIFDANRSILLIQRQDVPVWVLPGGGIEDNETAEEAVVREIVEETGLKVRVIRKVAEYTPINRLGRLTETFECFPLEGSLLKGSETRHIAYFPLDKLPKSLFFLHKEWLNDALMNLKEPLKKPLENANYWNLIKTFLRHPFWVIRFLFTLLTNK